MAKAELDLEDVRVQLEGDDASLESEDTAQQVHHANISISERDRSHTAAVMDTDKSL